MRKFIACQTYSRIFIVLTAISILFSGLQAQKISRSGNVSVNDQSLKTGDLPCAGSVIFQEDFESGLPVGWVVVDGDSLTPRPEMQLGKGWQSRVDYRDTSNLVMVSPSWYVNPGQSNDWIITPQISLGGNPCLSWTAYSQDPLYKESYEIRVSVATQDTADFLANPVLYANAAEDGNPVTRALSLAAYAGQNVYIAFRQISDDKFVLALDDIAVSNVNDIDIGVYDLDYGTPMPGDTLRFQLTTANYGSDTITSFNLKWQVDGGAIQTMMVDSIELLPNGTHTVVHSMEYISDTVDMFYNFCAWTASPNGVADQDVSNDSLCTKLKVGSPVGFAEQNNWVKSINVYPNPFSGSVFIDLEIANKPQDYQIKLIDLAGKAHFYGTFHLSGHSTINVEPGMISPGLYFLIIENENGQRISRKLIKE